MLHFLVVCRVQKVAVETRFCGDRQQTVQIAPRKCCCQKYLWRLRETVSGFLCLYGGRAGDRRDG